MFSKSMKRLICSVDEYIKYLFRYIRCLNQVCTQNQDYGYIVDCLIRSRLKHNGRPGRETEGQGFCDDGIAKKRDVRGRARVSKM